MAGFPHPGKIEVIPEYDNSSNILVLNAYHSKHEDKKFAVLANTIFSVEETWHDIEINPDTAETEEVKFTCVGTQIGQQMPIFITVRNSYEDVMNMWLTALGYPTVQVNV